MKSLTKVSSFKTTPGGEAGEEAVNFGVYKKGKMRLMISERLPVYKGRVRRKNKVHPVIKSLRKQPVIYIIENWEGTPVYVGSSVTSGYKTILRHFQIWKDDAFDRKYYTPEKYRVRVVLSESMKNQINIWGIEGALIEMWRPVYNREGNYTPYNHKSAAAPKEVRQAIDEMTAFLLDAEPEIINTPLGDFNL